MRRKVIYPILFFSCLIVAGYLAIHNFSHTNPVAKPVNQPMQVVFESSQAVFSEMKLQGWSRLNNKFCSLEELTGYANQIQDALGVGSSITRNQASANGFNSIKVKGEISQDLMAEIILQSIWDKKEDKETYLIINISDSNHSDSLVSSKQKMMKAFQVFNQVPKTNQLLIGFKEGVLAKGTWDDLIKQIFLSIGGKINGGVEEGNYISKTGYVPNIGERLKVGESQVNFQVAISYNELEHKTYIYIGSPLVFSDY